jgi:hypothetical protein
MIAKFAICGIIFLSPQAFAQFTLTCVTNGTALTVTGYTGTPVAVTVPDTMNNLPVTAIAADAFWNCQSLVSLSLGTNMASLGDNAFETCSNLVSVTMANGLASIGIEAFENCTLLTNATIPGTASNIGTYAFAGCLNMSSVTLGNGITNVAQDMFYQCYSLTNVCLGNTVSSIGNDAFYGCINLTQLTIPKSVTNLGSVAFAGCGLTSITIPAGVTAMGEGVFWSCEGLTNVFFAGNAPTAGSLMFYGDNYSKLTTYYLPGTTGWSTTIWGYPTAGPAAVLWNPLIQTSGGSFGVRSNGFGFNITGSTNLPLVVMASANLANPVWTPLANLTLTNGSFYFTDPQWTNCQNRFYSLAMP